MQWLRKFVDLPEIATLSHFAGQSSSVESHGRLPISAILDKLLDEGRRRCVATMPTQSKVGILAEKSLEARAGIEPANKGFADLCLTTWLPRRYSSE